MVNNLKWKHLSTSLTIFILILAFSCKPENKINQVNEDSLRRINERDSIIYRLVELLIPSSPTQQYKTFIESYTEKDSLMNRNRLEDLNSSIEKDSSYNSEEKGLIRKLINNFSDTSGLDINKLGFEYKNYFNNDYKQTANTQTFYFPNIVFNDSMNLACTYPGTYYSDGRPDSKLGGYDELVFFKKEYNEWRIKERKTNIYY